MARRLFGTDGVRGVAGGQLTADLALALGAAAARHTGVQRPQALIVRDTRESGEMLEAAFAAGLSAAGADVLLGGVLPTPAAPLLLRRYGFELAAVISASHNPYQDNGIKIFGADGFKLTDKVEKAIEAEVQRGTQHGSSIGRIRQLRGAHEDYLRELHARFADLDLAGLTVALDCANGATSKVAPAIFRRLGAEVTAVADAPDGRNINDGCGSTHIERLGELVSEGGQDIGFAFDGDGDRVLAVDRDGTVVDGDELVALIAQHLQRQGRLSGNGVVVTVMTNYGFHAAMQSAGIEVATTGVGDRYVLEELRSRSWTLGGEQSGHIIDIGFNRSGDGIATALLTLEALGGASLHERTAMDRLPQRLINVRVADVSALRTSSAIEQETSSAADALEGRGRVLVRPSGTEPLVRVMVEAPTEAEANELCERIAATVASELGCPPA